MSLFRRTFVRQHVVRELADDQYILPVVSLRERVEAESRESIATNRDLRRLLSQQEFFSRGMSTNGECVYPEQQLYWPISVRSARRISGVSMDFEDLTSLIKWLSGEQNRQGILLTAASGAGKTLACRKAFFDCIESARDPAPLAGHIPCWVRIEGRLRAEHPIEFLVLRSVGIEMPLKELRWYLEYAPPLLLFFDLNSADVDDLERVTLGLSRFQLEWGRFGHRCVVASRSMPSGDPVLAALLDSSASVFQEFRLAPLSIQACSQYLRNHREFEREVRLTAGLKLPLSLVSPERTEDAIRRLENLLEHTKTSDGGFVSIPLLLHFTTEVTDRQAEVRSVTHLYDRIVEQHFGREEQTYGRRILRALGLTTGATRHELTIAALTRIAIAIRSRASGTLQMSVDDLRATLQKPPGARNLTDSEWYDSPVFSQRYDHEFIDRWLLSSSLLQCHGQTVRFLHDSFVDYFCGRYGLTTTAQKRRNQLNFTRIVKRLIESPKRWLGSVGFLGGVLTEAEFAGLAEQLLVSPPLDGLPKLVLELSQGAAPVVQMARTLATSHVIDNWRSLQDPHLLSGECHGILISEPNDISNGFADRIRDHFVERQLPFLHLTTPVERGWLPSCLHQASVWHMTTLPGERADRPGVVFVDSTGSLWCWWHGWDEARLVTQSRISEKPWGDDLHLLRMSDTTIVFLESEKTLRGRTHFTVARVSSSSVSVVGRGQLHGTIDDAKVIDSNLLLIRTDGVELKTWNPMSNSTPKTIATMPDPITTLAVHGQHLVAGCSTGRVFVVELAGSDPIELPTPEPDDPHGFGDTGRVNDVCFATPSTVVAGREDGCLLWWSLDTCTLLDSLNYASAFRILYPLASNEVVCVTTFEVMRWRKSEEFDRVATHGGSITAVEVLWDGSVVSADNDGFVRRTIPGSPLSLSFEGVDHVAPGFELHSVEGSHDAEGTTEGTLAQHGAGKTLLASTPDGVVVSTGGDWRIRFWYPRFGANRIRSPHTGEVNRLVSLATGYVCSMDQTGRGVLWDTSGKCLPPIKLYESEGPAIELSDGRVAVVSRDQFSFNIWNTEAGKTESGPGFFRSRDGQDCGYIRLECTCAVALPSGGLATAHANGKVYVWDTRDELLHRIPQDRENLPVIQHRSRVTAIAALSDGTVISGDEHGTLLAACGDRLLQLPAVPNSVLSIAPASRSTFLVASQGMPTIWEISLDQKSPIPRLRFDDGEDAQLLTVLGDGTVACLGTRGTIKRYLQSSGRVDHVMAASGRSEIYILPSGRIVVTDRGEVIEIIDPVARIVMPLVVDHGVTSVAERGDGEIVLGTSSGYVLRCRVQAPSRISRQRDSTIGPIDVGGGNTLSHSEEKGHRLHQRENAAESRDFVDSTRPAYLEHHAIGDPLFHGLNWVATYSRGLVAMMVEAERLSIRWVTDEISPVQLLLAIADDPQYGFKAAFTSLGIERDALEAIAIQEAPDNWESTLVLFRSRIFSPAARDWLNHAASLAKERGQGEVTTTHIVLSLFQRPVSPLHRLLEDCSAQLRVRLVELLQSEPGNDFFTETQLDDFLMIADIHRESAKPFLAQLEDQSPWCVVAVATRTVRLVDLKLSEWPTDVHQHSSILTSLQETLVACCVDGRASKELVSVGVQVKAAQEDLEEKRKRSKRSMNYDMDAVLFRVERLLKLHHQLLVVVFAVASRKERTVVEDALETLLACESLQACEPDVQASIERLDRFRSEEDRSKITAEYFAP